MGFLKSRQETESGDTSAGSPIGTPKSTGGPLIGRSNSVEAASSRRCSAKGSRKAYRTRSDTVDLAATAAQNEAAERMRKAAFLRPFDP